ncbi:MAG: AI-2E family transporter [Ruminococcus sp.]|nr:AI-2E family transporter [Ruminococcus sp.]
MLIILFTTALIFFFIHLSDVVKVLRVIISVINPILYGLIIAYVLNYPYKLFHNHAFKNMGKKHKWLAKFNKPLSIILSYILVFGIITYLISMMIPELASSIEKFIDAMPEYELTIRGWADDTARFVDNLTGYNLYEVATFNNVITLITGNEATEFFKNISSTLLPNAVTTMVDIGTGIYNWGLGIVISIYLISSKETLLNQARRVISAFTPEKFSTRFFHICTVFNTKCGKFIIGKIIDSSIIGLMCFIGMSIFRFDYPLLISVIIGLSNLIPFFGPFIGGIPSAVLLLLINPMEALWFVIFLFVLQQFDGNILGPKILGESVGISGFWIMVSVIVGGGLFGIVGMVLGVPFFAAIYALVSEAVDSRNAKKAKLKAEAEAANADAPAVEEASKPVQKKIQ